MIRSNITLLPSFEYGNGLLCTDDLHSAGPGLQPKGGPTGLTGSPELEKNRRLIRWRRGAEDSYWLGVCQQVDDVGHSQI